MSSSTDRSSRAPETGDVRGSGTFVVGHDGTERGRDAIALADDLAAASGARLLVVHVLPLVDEGLRAKAENDLAAVDLDALAAPAATTTIAAATPADGLKEVADREQADLIVIGATHRGRLSRALLGSLGDQLAHGAQCAVAVAPQGLARRSLRLRVIGAAFDMSPESSAAVRFAAGVASAHGATLRIVSVVPRAARHFADAGSGGEFAGPEATPRARLESALEHERDSLPARVRAEGRILEGDPAAQLVEAAADGIDLLVLGSRGHGALGRVVAGSVSTPVLDAAPCPVIVVPRPH